MTSLFPYSDDIKTSSARITSSFYLCKYVDKGKIMRILMRIDTNYTVVVVELTKSANWIFAFRRLCLFTK